MKRKITENISIDTVPLPERTVRVSIPPKLAYDLKSFQKVQASILDRLGCLACCSGWDIRWDILKDFQVDENFKVYDVGSGGGITKG